jgi:hypothetical protein
MNAIITIHAEALPFMDVAGPLWRKTCGHVTVITNPGCPDSFPWADEVYEWPNDPGHRGIEHCKRLLLGMEKASRMNGFTVLSEADGLLVHGYDFKPGFFYGSSIQSNLIYRKIIPNPYRPLTMFCPWVTDREGWVSMAAVLRGWISEGWVPDEGYADRVIAAAALDCGLSLVGAGFNRWPKLLPEDQCHVAALIESRQAPLIHAIKDVVNLAWVIEAARASASGGRVCM